MDLLYLIDHNAVPQSSLIQKLKLLFTIAYPVMVIDPLLPVGKYSRQMLLQNSILDEKLIWSIKPRSELGTANKHVTLNTCISNLVVCRGTGSRVPEVQVSDVITVSCDVISRSCNVIIFCNDVTTVSCDVITVPCDVIEVSFDFKIHTVQCCE